MPPARPAAPAFGMPGEQSGDNGLERSVRSQGDDTEAAAAPRAASAAEVQEPQQNREGQRVAQQQPDQLEVRHAVFCSPPDDGQHPVSVSSQANDVSIH